MRWGRPMDSPSEVEREPRGVCGHRASDVDVHFSIGRIKQQAVYGRVRCVVTFLNQASRFESKDHRENII